MPLKKTHPALVYIHKRVVRIIALHDPRTIIYNQLIWQVFRRVYIWQMRVTSDYNVSIDALCHWVEVVGANALLDRFLRLF